MSEKTSRRENWDDEEADLGSALGELARLKRRAWQRKWRTLAIALACALAVVGMRARKARSFSSRIVMRVTEADLDAATAPRPAKRLREYVLDVAFSNQRLLDVIRARKLYPSQLKKDPSLAVESMREDLDVEVWRNYFVELRQLDDAGRSARVAIEYRAPDPQVALDVVRELGRVITDTEAKARQRQAEVAASMADAAVEEARANLARRQGEIMSREVALARATKPAEEAMLRVELADLRQTLEKLQLGLNNALQKKSAFDLRAGLEQHQLGLQFEIVDNGRAARAGISRPRELAMIGLIVFLIVLPLVGIAVGALDGRVYDAEDVRRLGIHAAGHVPRFTGDNVGALDARLERSKRVS